MSAQVASRLPSFTKSTRLLGAMAPRSTRLESFAASLRAVSGSTSSSL